MLSAFPETRAVQGMKSWPFRVGLAAVRFREASRTLLPPPGQMFSDSAELRVISVAECIFVPHDWRSHLSWSSHPSVASPFALKGHVVSGPDGTQVTGRLSLAATLGIPGMMVWLGGCGLLGLREHPGLSAVLLLAGIGVPAGLTWATLPKEIARFRALWEAVRLSLRQGTMAREGTADQRPAT